MNKLIKTPSSKVHAFIESKFSLPKYDVHSIMLVGENLIRFRRTHISQSGGSPFQYYKFEETDDTIVLESTKEPEDIKTYKFEDSLPF